MPFAELPCFAYIEQGDFGFVVEPGTDDGSIDDSHVVSD
jgi:hypothetical protein